MNNVESGVDFIDSRMNICQLITIFELGSNFFIKRMNSKIELVILNGHNYEIWEIDVENLLKRKGL